MNPRGTFPSWRSRRSLRLLRFSFYFFIEWTQPVAQFVYRITIPAGRRVGRNLQGGGDLLKRQARPQLQVRHGALLGRQFGQRGGQFLAKRGLIRIARRREGRNHLPGKILPRPLAGAPAAQPVNCGIVGQPEEKSPLLADAAQQVFIVGKFDEYFLEQIAGIRLIPRQVQKEGMERLRVFVVEPCDVQIGGHFTHMTRPPGEFV